jgi:hypothetical protein
MEQFVKAGLSARHRGVRIRTAAWAVLAAAGVGIVAGIALAATERAGEDDHLWDGPLPAAWLDTGIPDPSALNGPLSGPLSDPLFGIPSAVPMSAMSAGDAPSGALPLAASPVRITYRITSGNALGLTVVNNGLVGNNFSSRSPSFEYPLGSNIDHMPRGGIWVGAVTLGGDSLVSTATVDGAVSGSLPIAEFLPVGGTIIEERSMLPESRYYDARARSEQDFLYSCADTAASLQDPIPGATESHRPLKLRIDTETLLYSFEPFEAIVIVNFKIINTGLEPLYDVCVGFYAELASGYKNASVANWTSGWFKKKLLEYADSTYTDPSGRDPSRMVMEHKNSSSLPGERATSWSGIKLLGTKPTPIGDCQVSFNWWNWDPSRRWRDTERYRLLGNAETDITTGINPGTDDPVEVLSVTGDRNTAFGILEGGDTLTVSYAFVGGQDDQRVSGRGAREDLLFNAGWAQKAYDLNYRIPMPPPSPRIEVTPGHNSVTLAWSGAGPELFRDPQSHKRDFEGYRILVSEERTESGFRRILERDLVDSVGYNTGLGDIRDSLITPARPETIWTDATPPTIDHIEIRPEIWHYRYTIDGLRDGFKYWVAATAFDRGTLDVGSLESGIGQNLTFVIPGSPASKDGRPKVTVFPNPYRGDAAWDGSLRRDRYLWFANLPPRCVIRIYTLAGDLVDTINFDQATYRPIDIRGIFDPTDPRDPERDLPVLSGGMAAWDLVSRKDQGVASGLYLYAVEDRDGGDRQVGKFLIVK